MDAPGGAGDAEGRRVAVVRPAEERDVDRADVRAELDGAGAAAGRRDVRERFRERRDELRRRPDVDGLAAQLAPQARGGLGVELGVARGRDGLAADFDGDARERERAAELAVDVLGLGAAAPLDDEGDAADAEAQARRAADRGVDAVKGDARRSAARRGPRPGPREGRRQFLVDVAEDLRVDVEPPVFEGRRRGEDRAVAAAPGAARGDGRGARFQRPAVAARHGAGEGRDEAAHAPLGVVVAGEDAAAPAVELRGDGVVRAAAARRVADRGRRDLGARAARAEGDGDAPRAGVDARDGARAVARGGGAKAVERRRRERRARRRLARAARGRRPQRQVRRRVLHGQRADARRGEAAAPQRQPAVARGDGGGPRERVRRDGDEPLEPLGARRRRRRRRRLVVERRVRGVERRVADFDLEERSRR